MTILLLPGLIFILQTLSVQLTLQLLSSITLQLTITFLLVLTRLLIFHLLSWFIHRLTLQLVLYSGDSLTAFSYSSNVNSTTFIADIQTDNSASYRAYIENSLAFSKYTSTGFIYFQITLQLHSVLPLQLTLKTTSVLQVQLTLFTIEPVYSFCTCIFNGSENTSISLKKSSLLYMY